METEIEPELELENWMIDDFFWNQGVIDWSVATDKNLTLEAWMIDDAYWQ
ncbi:hypothetical protein [Sunxiuqinia sp. sy24]